MIGSNPMVANVIQAPVREVTFLEDRAQVTRRAQLSLPAGWHRVSIADVSPLVVDRSLMANLSEPARLDEIKVVRRWFIGSAEKPADAAALQAESERLENDVQHQQELLEILGAQRDLLQRAAELYVDNLNREMPFVDAFPERWESGVNLLHQRANQASERWFDARSRLEELVREQEGVELRWNQGARPDQQLKCSLQIDLEVARDFDVNLEVAYLVPCALWRPIHRARLEGERVRFSCEAAVWQNTGEDWTTVQCRFSTARSTQQAEPPELKDDWLQVQRKQERQVEVVFSEQVVADTGEGRVERNDGLPGVDDGGEVRTLPASGTFDFQSDGRMRRIPLFDFESEARSDRLCCPELDPLVHQRTMQENRSSAPLLAGPVDLVSEGGHIGRGRIDFIAPHERFALPWGSDDGLRVRREVDERREAARMTGKQTVTRTVRLFASNLDDRPRAFVLQERIPVSEIDKVQIRLDEQETTPGFQVDDHGRVNWPVSLGAHEPREIVLQYRIITSGEVQGV